jgi:pyruvate formate lyase activating enzyme
MTLGLISNIQRYAIHDGPGIRTTVFLKGCPARCWWCQNPEAVKEAPNDRVITVDDLLTEIKKDVIFYETSGGGVTFSGGEPLMQPEFLEAVLDECNEKYIHTALDTAGYAQPPTFLRIANKTSLILYDIKLMNNEKHEKYTGISNELMLHNLKEIAPSNKVILRFPVIPGITDTDENVVQIKEFVSSLKGINEIDLLPYHRMAEVKYQKLGLEYKLQGLMPPSDERMNILKKEFEDYGFKVKIGG